MLFVQQSKENLNLKNASIFEKVYIKYVSRSRQIFYIIWGVGGIYILVIKRAGDGNTGLNIGDLNEGTRAEQRLRTRIKIKN